MTVIIMRGVPGSGKSTYAKASFPGAVICSADDFFTKDGVYRFDGAKIGMAHAECFSKFMRAITAPLELQIIIDNTNTQLWEMAPYRAVAHHFGHGVRIIRMACDPEIAASRCVHDVPWNSVMNMQSRMENTPSFWGGEEVVRNSVVSGIP